MILRTSGLGDYAGPAEAVVEGALNVGGAVMILWSMARPDNAKLSAGNKTVVASMLAVPLLLLGCPNPGHLEGCERWTPVVGEFARRLHADLDDDKARVEAIAEWERFVEEVLVPAGCNEAFGGTLP